MNGVIVNNSIPLLIAIFSWHVLQLAYLRMRKAIERRHVTRIKMHDKKVLLLHELPEHLVKRFHDMGRMPSIHVMWEGNSCIEEWEWIAFKKELWELDRK